VFTKNKNAAFLYILPALLFFSFFVAYPIIANFINSFYRFSAISISKELVGFQNYHTLLNDKIFWKSIFNNILFAAASIVIQVGLGLLLAAILQRGIHAGKKIFRSIFFLPMVMSVVSVGLLWKFIYDPIFGALNLITSFFGIEPVGWLGEPNIVIWAVIVTACWQYTGFNMVMLLAGMQGINTELYEAASIDGSNEIKNFFRITIPCISEVVSVVVLITLIGSFKVFDYVWVMTRGGPDHSSEVLTTYIYLLGFTTDRMGYASTVASILFLVTFIFTLIRIKMMKEEF